MLVLNRRVGQSICISDMSGERACTDRAWVTVFASRRDRVVVVVMAPTSMQVRSEDAEVSPAIYDPSAFDGKDHQGGLKMLALRSGERFFIDATEVRLTFGRSPLRTQPKRVQLAIQAPAHLSVHREEIQQRIDAEASHRAPMLCLAKRLQQADVSVPLPRAPIPGWGLAGARAPVNAEFVFA
jgi:sRNA-binding carbon storage regulator CsrA